VTTRLKNVIRDAQRKLADSGAGSDTAASLIEPINEVTAAVEAKRIWANSLVLFRSREVFAYYMFYERWKESLTVGDRFQIRPLLSALTRESNGFISLA